MTQSFLPTPPTTIYRYRIWFVSVAFLLFQFFLQLSSGVMLNKIMIELQYSALTIGALGSAFYYVYTGLQIPVGLLFDRYNARHLLSLNALICAIGCFVFALSTQYTGLFTGRIIMGAGSAFAFVGVAHLLREYFPLNQFGFMMGLSDTLGFLVTVFGMIAMGYLLSQWGWRGFMVGAGIAGLIISCLCWIYIPQSQKHKTTQHKALKKIHIVLKNPLAWINGIFAGLGFSVITVFGALWAVPLVQLKLECGLFEASLVSAMIFLGAAIGFPIFGRLSVVLNRRKPLMYASNLLTALLLIIMVLCPIENNVFMAVLMFAIGVSCGSYLLAFVIINELTSKNTLSTCTGFINTLAMITAPLLQPLIGLIIDTAKRNAGLETLAAYQLALMIIPVALIVASVLVYFLPEKRVMISTSA